MSGIARVHNTTSHFSQTSIDGYLNRSIIASLCNSGVSARRALSVHVQYIVANNVAICWVEMWRSRVQLTFLKADMGFIFLK